jgi:hypothetical protein
VYEFAIERLGGAVTNFNQNIFSDQADNLPPVCKAIPEAILVWIWCTNFSFSCHTVQPSIVARFLETMTPIERGLESVRIPWFQGVYNWKSIINGKKCGVCCTDLMKHCPGLQIVRLWNWYHNPDPKQDHTLEVISSGKDTINEIVEAYGLGEFFHCRTLREISVGCHLNKSPGEPLITAMEWIRTEFQKRNNQTIRIYSSRYGEENIYC